MGGSELFFLKNGWKCVRVAGSGWEWVRMGQSDWERNSGKPFRNNRKYSKKCTKNKYVCLKEVI